MADNENEKNLVTNPVTPEKPKLHFLVVFFTFASSIGGFLFGYDVATASAVLILIKPVFNMTSFLQGAFVSLVLLSSAFVCLIAGVFADWIGRKYVILIGALLFMVGSGVMAAATHISILFIGRIIFGIGLGLSSTTSPIYMAECSNKHHRGKVVATFSVFITMGQLVSSIVCALLAEHQYSWRLLLGLEALPALIQLLSFLVMPESPRWLVAKNRVEEAKKVMTKFAGIENVDRRNEEVENELMTIQDDIAEKSTFKDLTRLEFFSKIFQNRHLRKALIIGALLQIFEMLTGIDSIMYYLPVMIQMLGVSHLGSIMWATALFNVWFLACCFSGLGLIDRAGRRPLTLISLLGAMMALILIGSSFLLNSENSTHVSFNLSTSPCPYSTCDACVQSNNCVFCSEVHDPKKAFCSYYNTTIVEASTLDIFDATNEYCGTIYDGFKSATKSKTNKTVNWIGTTTSCISSYSWIAALGVVVYTLFFALGIAMTAWAINSEIYPNWARSTCSSIVYFIRWISSFTLALTFLPISENIYIYGTFFLYASFCLVGFGIALLFLPETKDKVLEEVENLFRNNLFVVCSKNKYQSDSNVKIK